MLTITTYTGKTFECDLAVENPSPSRLYMHIVNCSLSDVARTFTDEAELPIEGYPAYTAFDSMNVTPDGGINICLK